MNLRTKLLCGLVAASVAVLAAQAQVPGVNSTLNSVFTLAYDNSTMKQTFSATRAGITAVASQTDMCSITGSATKTVKVRRIFFNNESASAVAEPVSIVKRSTANTGSGTALAVVPYDSNNAATSVALAEVWTAAPTVGTQVGILADVILPFGWVSSATVNSLPAPYAFTFGALGQPIVLRGAAEQVSINLSGITLTGTVSCTFEWTEE